ncbi:hypothetical protein FCM35_KLT07875 [Carex littledalei]|uniref:Uncharacterized protein n=1 Tax=Carex littledalei TaxID=544730 RepID=A0A833QV00_9POAL|nr:hypothetical protein FCM35_KLT07875 [Carex littledalei]
MCHLAEINEAETRNLLHARRIQELELQLEKAKRYLDQSIAGFTKTDVLGVYNRPPSDSDVVLLKEIVKITMAAHDSIGGMEAKIIEAAITAKLGFDVYITKALKLSYTTSSRKSRSLFIDIALEENFKYDSSIEVDDGTMHLIMEQKSIVFKILRLYKIFLRSNGYTHYCIPTPATLFSTRLVIIKFCFESFPMTLTPAARDAQGAVRTAVTAACRALYPPVLPTTAKAADHPAATTAQAPSLIFSPTEFGITLRKKYSERDCNVPIRDGEGSQRRRRGLYVRRGGSEGGG